MYDFQDKKPDKHALPSSRKPAASQRPRQSGDRVKLSAFGDKEASASLQGVNRVMPEKMRLKEQKPGEPMTSVKPGAYSGKEKSPDKLMELETDTGRAEIGYDRKRMHTVVSFMQDEQSSKGKQVVENKSLVKRAMGGNKFRSNDRSFEDGAMCLRVDGNSSARSIRRQLQKGSDKQDPTTMDRVIPFHTQAQAEKQQRLRLLQRLHRTGPASKGQEAEEDRGISKAVTALSTMEGQKSRMGLEFRQKFDKAVKKSRHMQQQNDMYIFLLRKKRLVLEALAQGEPIDIPELVDDVHITQVENAENMESEVWKGPETNGIT